VRIATSPGHASVEEPASLPTRGRSSRVPKRDPGIGAAPTVFWVVAEGRFELPAKGL
jgi:hypothetical protein